MKGIESKSQETGDDLPEFGLIINADPVHARPA
jgi:hypothetical protein